MIGIIGILIAVILLIILVYNKIHPIICVLIASLIAGLSNGESILEIEAAFTNGMLDFAKPVLWLFILSAIYGKLMEKVGNADSIAHAFVRVLGEKYCILALILSTALLVYGGISVFTVIFCIYPIGLAVLKKADLPRYLLPGIVVIGQITFAMTALPGTPQMNNIIPAGYFQTTLMAAPLLGLVCAALMFVLSYAYIMCAIKRTKAEGIGFAECGQESREPEDENCFWKAILPVIVMFVTYFLLGQGIIENTLTVYQSVDLGLVLAIISILLFNLKKRKQIAVAVKEGCNDWVRPMVSLCIIIGFGSVVKNTRGFEACVALLLNPSRNVYASAALSTAVVSGITASASGGIQIACSTFANTWLQSANPAILHRICSIASCSLDSLPHSGGIYSTFEICKVDLKQGYKYVFVVSVIIPAVVTVIAVILGNMGIC